MSHLKVVTINLLNDDFKKAERIKLLIEQLKIYNPDIIALQEVDLDSKIDKFIIDRFRGYSHFISSRPGRLHHKEGLLFLSKPKILFSKTIVLDRQERVAQQIVVSHNNKKISLVNVHMHWSIVSDRIRLKHANQLIRLTPKPHIIMGDFNATKDMGSIKLVLSKYQNVNGLSQKPTYPSPFKRHGPRALIRHNAIFWLGLFRGFKLHGWSDSIDYIFVDNKFQIIDTEVTFNNPSIYDESVFVSDHYGLLATVKTN